jgi:DNA-binding transcriptional LysR family regulator
MHEIDASSLDLNLLPALLLLVEERSVTRAARRAHRTQSAMSHTLGRLRDLLGDPILVRAGRHMEPTPRAAALMEPLARLLGETRRVLAEGGAFDPATTTQKFQLLAPDVLAPLLPALMARLQHAAPHVRLELATSDTRDVPGELDAGRADLALAPLFGDTPALIARRVGAVSWCIVMRRDHPAARGRFTALKWSAHPHVVVRTGSDVPSLVGRALEQAGIARRVMLVVPGFLAALHAVAETDLLFAAPRELAAPLARPLGLVLCQPPISLPKVPVGALWHERMHGDAAHKWFRGVVVDQLLSQLPSQ